MSNTLWASPLSVGYTRPYKVIVPDLSLNLQAGELVCLLGPNGAGKSTLMRTLCGMQPSLAGRVMLDGQDLHALPPHVLATRMSTVLTERVDAGNLSAYDLAALGRHPYTGWSGRLRTTDHEAVTSALGAVNAEGLALRAVNELSDGERQKVLIARALAQEPDVMVLDEPTAYLDLPHRVEIMGMLHGLARRTGCAILLSTHDLDLALRNADRLWLLPPGGPLYSGAPEDLVLAGTFARIFHADGLVFDAHRGAFRTQNGHVEVVDLQGEGLAVVWTARALERAGFGVVHTTNEQPEEAQRRRVEVIETKAGPRWRTTCNRKSQEHGSIHALLQFMHSEERKDRIGT